MTRKGKILSLLFLLTLTAALIAFKTQRDTYDEKIISYIVDPRTQNLQFYWKNDQGEILKSIQNLKSYVEGKNQKLIFAMNGGMFNKAHLPQGLYIQNKQILANLDTSTGRGNFYLHPNGVFFLTDDNNPRICKTTDFKNHGDIAYATQSGPMLIADGKIHSAFSEGSTNLNIRNGVGIMPDNRIVFAMSKIEINFYDFAKYFQRLGCTNALYLDGSISRTFLPEQNWIQTDGDFGVMIGVTESKNK